MAQKEYELKLKQVNASIASSYSSRSTSASSGGSSSSSRSSSDVVLNTNYCLGPKSFSSTKAHQQYNQLLYQVQADGGIKKSVLNAYLNQGKSSGIFTSKDVTAIKKQFGI